MPFFRYETFFNNNCNNDNFYCMRRCAQALQGMGWVRTACITVMVCLACALPFGRSAELVMRNSVTHAAVVAGSLYLGFFFYMLLLTALADCIRLGDRMFHFFPSAFLSNPYPVARMVWFTLAAGLCLVVCVGYFLATHPAMRTYDLTIDKKSGPIKNLTIAAVSDIHFGTVVDSRHMRRIVRLVKKIHPDLVLLVGDVFDQDMDDNLRGSLVGNIREMVCPMGVFAAMGNHDYYSGLSKAIATLQEAGVTVLQDTAITIERSFVLAGRKDLTALRMGGSRAKLRDILSFTDRSLPCILMDHQPFHLEEAEINGVDLQLSGHTHHGQFFPLNLLYRWIYERSWGYLKKGETQIIVSCGAGTWGPPVRTNSRSEVLKIRVRFGGG